MSLFLCCCVSGQSVKIYAKVANASGALLDGQTVMASLSNAKGAPRVAVPPNAVALDSRGTYVWVVGAGGKAEQRRVVRGRLQGGRQIVASGLRVGETIVLDGVHRVADDLEVEVMPLARGGCLFYFQFYILLVGLSLIYNGLFASETVAGAGDIQCDGGFDERMTFHLKACAVVGALLTIPPKAIFVEDVSINLIPVVVNMPKQLLPLLVCRRQDEIL